MSPRQAARAHAEEQFARNGELGFFVDASADPVLIGLATRTCSCVVAVGKAEYDARTAENPLHLPEHFGFKQHQPSALERARRTR